MMAARWMRVAPWDLIAQDDPDFWAEAVSVISSAEREASQKSK